MKKLLKINFFLCSVLLHSGLIFSAPKARTHQEKCRQRSKKQPRAADKQNNLRAPAEKVLPLKIGILSTQDLDDSWPFIEQLHNLAQAEDIHAILIPINSLFLSTGSGYTIFNEIKQASKHKPIIALIENSCTGSCYHAMASADAIIASALADVGSIGVSMVIERHLKPHLDNDQMEADISYTVLQRGKFKTIYDENAGPLTDEQEEFLYQVLQDHYDQICEDIASTRHLDITKRDVWADGREFIGKRAATEQIALIDAVGSRSTAIDIARVLLKKRGKPPYGEALFAYPIQAEATAPEETRD